MLKRKSVMAVLLAGALLLAAMGLPIQRTATAGEGTPAGIGIVDFPVSCDKAAAEQFEHALALLHHMMYRQARDEFARVAELDPRCAMAHWGVAMTHFHPLWEPPTPESLGKGRAALAKAGRSGSRTEREQAYLDAATALYRDWSPARHRQNLAAWSRAQQAVFTAYPDDIDAGAFYALSLLATAPKADKQYSQQKQAGQLLEKLRRRAPQHPGPYHYLIHAYDNPVLAEQALDVARAYDKIAPEVPHALHMPSHIFVRLGIWPDAIEWNRRSAAAAKKQPVSGATSLHYFHALDYLVYAYLQQAQDERAAQALALINAEQQVQNAFASAYGIAAAQARYPLELRRWREAAQLPTRTPSSLPWDQYPWAEAIRYFARGLGAARSGDAQAAGRAAGVLDQLHQQTIEAGEDYWAVLVDAQRKTVRAWQTMAKGDKARAEQEMRAAAQLQDSMDKHPVTPGAVLPARELLGDMLLQVGKPREALQAYEQSLQVAPNRFHSLYGAARAAKEMQMPDRARHYYRALLETPARARSDREATREAKAYLGGL